MHSLFGFRLVADRIQHECSAELFKALRICADLVKLNAMLVCLARMAYFGMPSFEHTVPCLLAFCNTEFSIYHTLQSNCT